MSVTSSPPLYLLLAFLLLSCAHSHLLLPSDLKQTKGSDTIASNDVIQYVPDSKDFNPPITLQDQEKIARKQSAIQLAILARDAKNRNDQLSRKHQYFLEQVRPQNGAQGIQKQSNQAQTTNQPLGYENYQNNPRRREGESEDRQKVAFDDKILPTLKAKQSASTLSGGLPDDRAEMESEFVNHQQKTLYFRFVEMVAHLVKAIYQGPQAAEDSITSQDHFNPNQLNFTDIMQQNHQQTVPPPQQALKSYAVEQNERMVNETRGLARRRKKLYFIICILSFGVASITLIKISEENEKRKRSQRGGIMKVPCEEYEIQQI